MEQAEGRGVQGPGVILNRNLEIKIKNATHDANTHTSERVRDTHELISDSQLSTEVWNPEKIRCRTEMNWQVTIELNWNWGEYEMGDWSTKEIEAQFLR